MFELGFGRFDAWAFVAVLCVTGLSRPAHAQCDQWLPVTGVSGVQQTSIYAMTMWDADGPGPQAPKLVIGGFFDFAGPVAARNIAMLDLETGAWSGLAGAFNGPIYCLAVTADGGLVAGGSFSSAGPGPVGGLAAKRLAKWNGTQWHAFPTNSIPRAVATLVPTGSAGVNGDEFIAGGLGFAQSSGGGITHWSGAAWASLGGGLPTAVNALALMPDGALIAGGTFRAAVAPFVPSDSIARWDGVSWSPLSSAGGANAGVYALTVLPDGNLIAGGDFTSIGGVAASRIARWDGRVWSSLGAGVAFGTSQTYVDALAFMPDGSLIAGGAFTVAGDVAARSIARWDGAAWRPLGLGVAGEVYVLQSGPGGDLFVGGRFTSAGGGTAAGLARFRSGATTPVTINRVPVNAAACPTGAAVFSIEASGSQLSGLRWEWSQATCAAPCSEWRSVVDGPNSLSGSAVPLFSVSGAASGRLVVSDARPVRTSRFKIWLRAVVTDACGDVATRHVGFISCPADFSCDGAVGPQDLFGFIQAYFAGDPRADFDGSGATTTGDLFAFLDQFFVGCQ